MAKKFVRGRGVDRERGGGILNSFFSLVKNVQCQQDTQHCINILIHFEQLQFLLR